MQSDFNRLQIEQTLGLSKTKRNGKTKQWPWIWLYAVRYVNSASAPDEKSVAGFPIIAQLLIPVTRPQTSQGTLRHSISVFINSWVIVHIDFYIYRIHLSIYYSYITKYRLTFRWFSPVRHQYYSVVGKHMGLWLKHIKLIIYTPSVNLFKYGNNIYRATTFKPK